MIKKTAKLFSILLTVCMIATIFPAVSYAAAAGTTFTAGDFTYKVNTDTSTVTLTSIAVSALSGAVTVPETVSDGTSTYTVTQLDGAFKNQGAKTNNMTSLVLPDTITTFTTTATFYACKFTSIHLPSALTKEASNAGYLWNTFNWCNNLTSVTLPAGITKCYGAFRNSAVRTVTITGTSSVDFFAGSSTEGARAWLDGISGIKIYYPANGTAPTRYTGSFTATIEQIGGATPVPAANEFEDGDFKYKVIDGTDNVSVTGFSSASDKSGAKVLNETVTNSDKTYTVVSIGYAAFASQKKLTSFVMPDTVTSVGQNIFYGCTKLEYVHLSENLANVSASRQLVGTFYGCTALKTVIIPSGITCLPKTFINSGVENIVLKAKSTELPKGSNNEYVPVSNPDTVKIFYPSDGSVTGGYKTYISHYYIYEGTIAYEAKADSTLKVVSVLPGYNADANTVIPASIGALQVTEIADEAFSDTDEITSLTVSDSVTAIGERAFADCDNLEIVVLSNNLSGTLDKTFADCTSLTTVAIPEGVTTLNGTFEGCTQLSAINFADSVSALSNKALYGCDSLTDIAVPDTVLSITDGENTAGTVFPNGCTLIVRENSEALRYAQANNINYLIKDIVEYTINNNRAEVTKTNFKINGEYTIPAYISENGTSYPVSSIAANAFAGQDTLTVLNIPDTVASIGNNAFVGCDNADFAVRVNSGTTAYTAVKAAGVNYIADDTASGLAYKKYASESGLEIYGTAGNSQLTGAVAINAFDGMNVTSIGEEAFSGQSGITSVTMVNTVTSIGKSAFAGCTGLITATLSENAQGLLDSTFEGCVSLESIDIPAGITSLKNTYNGCTSLARADIPENVTAIYESTFANCTGLETVIIPETVTTFDRIVGFKDETQQQAEYVETNTSKKWVDNPFKGATNANLAICGVRGSAAEEFAYSSGIKFIDIEKGNYPLEYNKVSDKTFNVSVRNINEDSDVTVIGALYDADGKLINCKLLRTEFDTNDYKTVFSGEVYFPEYGENTTLKFMSWSDLENLAPVNKVSTVEEPETIKILVLGNSISLHGPSSSVGWFAPNGQGMAATSLDKDYVHTVLNKAKQINPNVEVKIVSAWSLEANFDQWQTLVASNEYKEAVDYDADIIIAQFGENVKNNANEGSLGGNFDNENEFNATIFANIVKAFISEGKDVPVIVVTSMMGNKPVVLNAKQEASTANGWSYVNLCNDSNFSESKNSAYYLTASQVEEGIANGTFHADTQIGSGVYVHPGNNGMRAIAYGVWKYVEPIIEEMTFNN